MERLSNNLEPFARDERLDRIENILEILMVSRECYYGRLESHLSYYTPEPIRFDLMPVRVMTHPVLDACCHMKMGLNGSTVDEGRLGSGTDASQLFTCQGSTSMLPRGSPEARLPKRPY